MLLGLLAIAGPIYLHLTRRQDQQERPFPSLMFLRKLPFKEKQQMVLRDKLLLALRCLAVAVVCLAFASPFFDQNDVADGSGYDHDIVLLFDASYSMGIANRDSLARDEAESRINKMASDERMALVAFDETARTVVELTGDKSALLAGVRSITVQPLSTHLSAAFDVGTRILSRSDASRQSVVLVSDVQATAVNTGVPFRMPRDGELEVIRIESELPTNATVTGASVTSAPEGGEHVVGFRVKNTGDNSIENLQVYARIDDRVKELDSMSLQEGEEKSAQTSLVLASDRPTKIEVGISGDSFDTDNRMYLTGIKGRVVNVGIVRTTIIAEKQSRFINAALARTRDDTIVTSVDIEDVKDSESRKNFEVLIVSDANLDESAKNALQEFVESGGGVLYVAGDQSNHGFGNKKSVTEPQTTLRLRSAAQEHPLAYRTELGANGTLSNVAVTTWRDIESGANIKPLLTFGAGQTILGEQVTDAGRTLLLATSFDPAWSTLALEPGFVAFAQRLVDYLASRTSPSASVSTGTSVDMTSFAGSLPQGGAWLSMLKNSTALIEAPDGGQTSIGPGQNVYVPRVPGIHQVHASSSDLASLPIAVNVDRTESEFAPGSSSDLRKRLIHDSARADTITLTPEYQNENARPIAWYLLAIAGLLFLLESIIGNRLTGNRRQTRST